MKLKHRGRWGWGIYGLNGWGIYGLNGWGIYDLNGCGIYDLNGWGHLWLKWMGRLVTVFGRYAQKKNKKNTGLQGSTLSGPRMTTGFGPFELPPLLSNIHAVITAPVSVIPSTPIDANPN